MTFARSPSARRTAKTGEGASAPTGVPASTGTRVATAKSITEPDLVTGENIFSFNKCVNRKLQPTNF